MGRTTRIVGGASIVLAPLMFGIGDQVRMLADPPSGAGIVGEYDPAASLASINANRPTFVAASYLFYLAMLLTIPALLTIWRLSVDRTPRWAWAGAVMATMFVLGQTVHLVGHFGMSQVFSAYPDLDVAAELTLAAEANSFIMVLFVPLYLIGMLAAIPQAIGLTRARVIPRWACVAVLIGTVVFMTLGSLPWTTALWTGLLVAGFGPSAIAALRGRVDLVHAATEPATAAV